VIAILAILKRPFPSSDRFSFVAIRKLPHRALSGIVIAYTEAVSNAEDKISRAVQRCIARCDGKTPIGVIAEFLAELRHQGWSESEIRQVETAARRILAGIIDPSYLPNPFDSPSSEVVA